MTTERSSSSLTAPTSTGQQTSGLPHSATNGPTPIRVPTSSSRRPEGAALSSSCNRFPKSKREEPRPPRPANPAARARGLATRRPGRHRPHRHTTRGTRLAMARARRPRRQRILRAPTPTRLPVADREPGDLSGRTTQAGQASRVCAAESGSIGSSGRLRRPGGACPPYGPGRAEPPATTSHERS